MTTTPLRLMCIGLRPEAAALLVDAEIEALADAGAALARLRAGALADVVVADADGLRPADAAPLDELLRHAPVIVVGPDSDGDAAAAWLRCGADDVVGHGEVATAALPRRIRFAALRRARQTEQAAAWSTDAGTGLPHRQQLVEHLSQLLALREREPAPMAVVVLRIEGLAARGGLDGTEVDALRRKLAVRLRAGVRASDVVAAVDNDSFAVLLGSLLAPGDAERVADKLAVALVVPMAVAGVEREIAVALGIALYPQDGDDAERLLRRAAALAAAAPAAGRDGPAAARGAEGALRIAANDEGI